MNKIFIIITTILSCSFLSINEPVINIESWNKIYDISQLKTIRVKKGDKIEFSKVEFDDSLWKKVSLPHSWDKMYPKYTDVVWYRIHIKFPLEKPLKHIGLRFGKICNIEDLYINGTLIKKNIIKNKKYNYHYNKVRIYEIPFHLINPGTKNIIAFRIMGLFPSMNGPVKGNFFIGPYEKIFKDLIFEELFQYTLILLYLISSLFFLLFSFSYPEFKEYIVISLLTLFSGIYFLSRSQVAYMYFDSVNVLKAFEYISLFIIFLLVMEFITRFVDSKHFWLHSLYYGYTAVIILLFAFIQDRLILNFILSHIVQPSWSIPIIFTVVMIFRNMKYIRDLPILAGTIAIMILLVIHDVLSSQGISPHPFLSRYGFLSFNIALVIMTIRRTITVRLERDELKDSLSRRRTKTVTEQTKKILDDVISIIDKDYKTEIDRASLSENYDMSSDYLSKMFKRYTGSSLNDYINQKRIHHSLDELNNSKKSITEIAFNAGFESLSTFYRAFQKYTGKTPKDYRKEEDYLENKETVKI